MTVFSQAVYDTIEDPEVKRQIPDRLRGCRSSQTFISEDAAKHSDKVPVTTHGAYSLELFPGYIRDVSL